MIIPKSNRFKPLELSSIKQTYLKWLNSDSKPEITIETNVLEWKSSEEIYGHLLGVFHSLHLIEDLGYTPSQFLDFLLDVALEYKCQPYHSFYHAADVALMTYYLVSKLGHFILSPTELAELMIAALCHDTGHPGFNNSYQVNQKTFLANHYENESVLENYSADITQKLLEKHGLLSRDSYQSVRSLILRTDMESHWMLQNEAASLADELDDISLQLAENDPDKLAEMTSSVQKDKTRDEPLNSKQRHLLCGIILHAADISNAVRPWSIAKMWSDRITQEFHHQGDHECISGIPISPGMDRLKDKEADTGIKFGQIIVKPYFDQLARLIPSACIFLKELEKNHKNWELLKSEREPCYPKRIRSISSSPQLKTGKHSFCTWLGAFCGHDELTGTEEDKAYENGPQIDMSYSQMTKKQFPVPVSYEGQRYILPTVPHQFPRRRSDSDLFTKANITPLNLHPIPLVP